MSGPHGAPRRARTEYAYIPALVVLVRTRRESAYMLPLTEEEE